MELHCTHCSTKFSDATGQLAATLELAVAGRLALVLGCGRCGALFFPAIRRDATAPLAESPTMLDQRPRVQFEGAARYEVLRTLGEGGMGVVLLARDRESGAEVCIKRLQPGVARAALRQELDALRRLEHPHIVRLLNNYEDAGREHLVLEYVRGEGLDRYLLAHGPLDEPLALEILRQVLDAVVYAHERRIIHRDLKPANVILEWRGPRAHAHVLDFGIALVDDLDDAGWMTAEFNPVGTPIYMAPEQVRGEMLSPVVDVYALGVMLAELLLGRPPYDVSLSCMQIVAKKVLEHRDCLDLSVVPATAPTLELIRSFTHTDPAQRPPVAMALEQVRMLLQAG